MRVVIMGAGYAGVACAVRLARAGRGRVEVCLVNEGPAFVERIRLHQAAVGQALAALPLEALLRGTGVRLVVGRAEVPDLAARCLWVGEQCLHWDRLVLALGCATAPGPSAAVHRLEPAAVMALARALNGMAPGERVAVVGGGLCGIEAAGEIAESFPGLTVTLFSRSPLAAGWAPAAREHLLRGLTRLRVGVHEGHDVLGFDGRRVQLASGEAPAELCLWTGGFQASNLPRAAGMAVEGNGRVWVAPSLRSLSHPQVYAAGDIAAPWLDPGLPLPMGCKSALPMGVQVARNLLAELDGREPQGFDFAAPFYCVSLGRRDGVVQFGGAGERSEGRVLRGRVAARFKEWVSRATRWSLRMEARGLGVINWPRTGRAPERLPELPSVEGHS